MSLLSRIVFLLVCSGWVCVSTAQQADDQEAQDAVQLGLAQIEEITTAERLMIQDIEHSIELDRPGDAVDRLIELSLKESMRLVAYGRGTDGFVYHFPLTIYLQQRLLDGDETSQKVLHEYRRRVDPIAKQELDRLTKSGNFGLARRNADRFLASSYGAKFALAAADYAMTRGWWDEASSLTSRCAPSATFATQPILGEQAIALPWPWIVSRIKDSSKAIEVVERNSLTKPPPLRPLPYKVVDHVFMQLIAIERAKGNSTVELESCFDKLSSARDGEKPSSLKAKLKSIPRSIADQDHISVSRMSHATYAGTSDRSFKRLTDTELTHEVRWSMALPQSSGSALLVDDLVPGLRSPALAPLVWNDRLLLPLGDQLRVYESATGKPWPLGSRSVPIWRSQFAPAQLIMPVQLPVNGRQHVTLSREGDIAVLRDGSPITGWLPVARRDNQPLTRVVAIDLKREGRLLDGFPWVPKIEGLPEGLEVDGAPLIVDELIYVPLLHRDAANMQSYLVCLNLSGQVLWASPRLAAARFHEANGRLHVSHSLVSYSQGTLFFHSSLGTVVALDAETGAFRWLTQYPRFELPRGSHALRRGMQRDITTLLVDDELVFVAPADSDRIFALMRSTGQLMWALAPGEANDAAHLTGVNSNHLIVSGDRLYWIDRLAGGIVAAVPSAAPNQPFGALPSPRGIAPAVLTKEQIIFPTESELLIYSVALDSQRQPKLVDRLNLQRLGIQSGVCTITDGLLLINSDRMLSALEMK